MCQIFTLTYRSYFKISHILSCQVNFSLSCPISQIWLNGLNNLNSPRHPRCSEPESDEEKLPIKPLSFDTSRINKVMFMLWTRTVTDCLRSNWTLCKIMWRYSVSLTDTSHNIYSVNTVKLYNEEIRPIKSNSLHVHVSKHQESRRWDFPYLPSKLGLLFFIPSVPHRLLPLPLLGVFPPSTSSLHYQLLSLPSYWPVPHYS